MSANVASELGKYRSLTITLIAGFTVSVVAFGALLSVDVDEARRDVAMQSRLTALTAQNRLEHLAVSIATLTEIAAHSDDQSDNDIPEQIRAAAEQLNLAKETLQYCFWTEGSERPFARQADNLACPPEIDPRSDLMLAVPASPLAESAIFIDGRQSGETHLNLSAELAGGISLRLTVSFDHLITPPAGFNRGSDDFGTDICLFWNPGPESKLIGCNRGYSMQNLVTDPNQLVASAIAGDELKFAAAGIEWQIVTILGASAATSALSFFPFAALLFFLLATAGACFYVFKTTDANLKLSKERQRVETAIREVEKRNDDLEQFAYMASHDLQTPVRHIISRSAMLVDDIADEDYSTAKRHAGIISDAAGRMQAFILDLLAFCRAGNDQLTPARVDIALLVDRQMQMIRDAEPTLGLCISTSNLPIVQTDEVKLSQVFQNLLTNCVKFARPGKPLTIDIEAAWNRQDNEWQISVVDNGIGIASEQLDRIFLPFKVLDVGVKSSGTGIGLSICRRVVTALGGRIWVESQPGVGSTFYFTLPDVYTGSVADSVPSAPARRTT